MDYNLITVAEIGQFAPEVDTSKFDAATLSGIVSQASRQVSDQLEFTPIAEDIVGEVATGRVTSEGDLLIFPQKPPIQSVTSIGITKGTVSVSLNLVNSDNTPRYNLDFTQRSIRYPQAEVSMTGQVLFYNLYQLRFTQFFTKISYRGGWEVSDLPPTLKRACILYVKDILAGQFNATGATQLRQGAVMFGFGRDQEGKSKLVAEAERLINPYRRIN